ncbi:MAG: hypothetical protein ACLFVR_09950 [Thiohalospira sp.]
MFEELKQQQKTYDSLCQIHQDALNQLNKLDQRIVVENEKTRNSLTDKANKLTSEVNKSHKKDNITYIVHYILFALLLILIFYLIIIFKKSSRESIEYLLSQTGGLREQNYEIIERAEELKKIEKH